MPISVLYNVVQQSWLGQCYMGGDMPLCTHITTSYWLAEAMRLGFGTTHKMQGGQIRDFFKREEGGMGGPSTTIQPPLLNPGQGGVQGTHFLGVNFRSK